MKKFEIIYIFFFIAFSCKKEVVKTNDNKKPKSVVKYAKGFDIINEKGSKKLIIKCHYFQYIYTLSKDLLLISEISLLMFSSFLG